jgi:hypothetical protein
MSSPFAVTAASPNRSIIGLLLLALLLGTRLIGGLRI